MEVSYTPAVMVTCHRGHEEVEKILQDNKCKYYQHKQDSPTPFIVTTKDLYKNKLEIQTAEICPTDGFTALMLACVMGHERVIKLLLDYRADVNLQTEGGWSALMFASQFGHSQAVNTLLHYCAEVNQATAQGKTALMLTIEARHLQVVHLFGELVHANHSEHVDMPLIHYQNYSPSITIFSKHLPLKTLRQTQPDYSSICGASLNYTNFSRTTNRAIMFSSPHSHTNSPGVQFTTQPIHPADGNEKPSTTDSFNSFFLHSNRHSRLYRLTHRSFTSTERKKICL